MKKGTIVLIISLIIAILVDVTGFILLFTYASTPGFQLRLGEKYLDIGSYSEAILAFNKVISISPNASDGYIGLSKAYMARNNPEKAKEMLELGLERTDSEDIRWELKLLSGDDKSGDEAADEPENRPAIELPARQGEGLGILSGTVSSFGAAGGSPISGASVSVYSDGALVQTAAADQSGNFVLDLEDGVYRVEISADGYHPLISEQKVTGNSTTYAQHFLMIDQRDVGQGLAGGMVYDAATGAGVSEVQVEFFTNWNNPGLDASGGEWRTRTDSSGYYEINAPVGYYTAVLTKGDYIRASYNVIVVSGEPNRQQNIAITQTVPMDQIRVVLRWGESPYDLDSHLVVPLPNGGRDEVFFSRKSVSYDGVELANLDVDDTTSYGPETVTILNFDGSGEYLYYIHDYSNRSSRDSTQMSYSGATVSLYVGDSLYDEYSIPVGQAGRCWEVFRLNGTGVYPINRISNEVDGSVVLSNL